MLGDWNRFLLPFQYVSKCLRNKLSTDTAHLMLGWVSRLKKWKGNILVILFMALSCFLGHLLSFVCWALVTVRSLLCMSTITDDVFCKTTDQWAGFRTFGSAQLSSLLFHFRQEVPHWGSRPSATHLEREPAARWHFLQQGNGFLKCGLEQISA